MYSQSSKLSDLAAVQEDLASSLAYPGFLLRDSIYTTRMGIYRKQYVIFSMAIYIKPPNQSPISNS